LEASRTDLQDRVFQTIAKNIGERLVLSRPDIFWRSWNRRKIRR
jgi:hypothetical protein